MWIVNFCKELRAWHIVKKVYKKNRAEFEAMKIRCNWFGKLCVVINRKTDIELGSDEDAVYLKAELALFTNLLVKHNIMDILAYELKPLEDERTLPDGNIEYEHGYLIEFTPAWDLSRQYVTVKSVSVLLFSLAVLGVGIWHAIEFIF